MVIEIVLLVLLAGAFIVLKIFQSESERKRKLEREERKIRDKAATGGFATNKMYVQTENDSEEEITMSEPDSSEDN
jgi:hypothetical protein